MGQRISELLISVILFLLVAIQHEIGRYSVTISFLLGVGLISFSIYYGVKRRLLTINDKVLDWQRIIWIVVSLLGIIFVNELGNFILFWESMKMTSSTYVIGQMGEGLPHYLDVFNIILVAPVTEEIIFRGIVPNLIFKGREVLGTVLASLLFGLSHGISTVGDAIIYIGGGLVFALICHRYNRLTDSMIVHIIYNSL